MTTTTSNSLNNPINSPAFSQINMQDVNSWASMGFSQQLCNSMIGADIKPSAVGEFETIHQVFLIFSTVNDVKDRLLMYQLYDHLKRNKPTVVININKHILNKLAVPQIQDMQKWLEFLQEFSAYVKIMKAEKQRNDILKAAVPPSWTSKLIEQYDKLMDKSFSDLNVLKLLDPEIDQSKIIKQMEAVQIKDGESCSSYIDKIKLGINLINCSDQEKVSKALQLCPPHIKGQLESVHLVNKFKTLEETTNKMNEIRNFKIRDDIFHEKKSKDKKFGQFNKYNSNKKKFIKDNKFNKDNKALSTTSSSNFTNKRDRVNKEKKYCTECKKAGHNWEDCWFNPQSPNFNKNHKKSSKFPKKNAKKSKKNKSQENQKGDNDASFFNQQQ